MARALIASVVHFALTFGAGFCLAFIRTPFLEPRLGPRWAELIELPAMIVVIVLACRWTLRRLAVPQNAGARLVMGLAALALMPAAEPLIADSAEWRRFIRATRSER